MHGELGCDPRLLYQPQVNAVARPRVGRWIADKGCPNWIEMNVLDQRQQIAIFINQMRVITALEQMPGGRQPELNGSRVSARDASNQTTERHVGYLH